MKMSDDNKEELSLTVLGDALERGIPLDDPEVIALAKAARNRTKNSTWYKTKQAVKENIPKFVVAIMIFGGATIGTLITLWSKQ